MPDCEVISVPRRISDVKRNQNVEDAHYKNAVGYYYTEEVSATRKEVVYKDGKREREITTPVALVLKRYKAPETTAQINWLKNQMPCDWNEKRTAADDVPVPINKISMYKANKA
jgi:hypothetical protein